MKHVNDGTPPVASPLTWGIDELGDKPRPRLDDSIEDLLEFAALELAWQNAEYNHCTPQWLIDELRRRSGREQRANDCPAKWMRRLMSGERKADEKTQGPESLESIFTRRGFVLSAEVVALDPSHRADELFIGVCEQIGGREVVRPLVLRSVTSQLLGVVFLYYEPIVGPNESSSVRLDQVEAAWSAWMLARAGGR